MLSPSFFTPQSWQDAMDIAEYIGADNSEAAARFLHALEGACTQLAALPGMGSRLTVDAKALQGARMLPITGFEHYLIFYRATTKSIQVIRVLHTARDFPTIFGE
jgi:toxin ParE1/3/4